VIAFSEHYHSSFHKYSIVFVSIFQKLAMNICWSTVILWKRLWEYEIWEINPL